MLRQVDVAIIGAGTAGLSAVKEIKKFTDNYLLIDRGPLGTTCSRVGCMPSKVLIQIAHDLARGEVLRAINVTSSKQDINIPAAMIQVRKMRDYFVDFTLRDIEEMGDHFLQAEASFLNSNRLAIKGSGEIEAKSIIIATGSSPFIPKEWEEFKDRIVTTDSLFELDNLDPSWGVVGLGPLGLELGQALALLGLKVSGFDKNATLGGLKDERVNEEALASLKKSFSIELNADVKLSRHGDQIRMASKNRTVDVDRVLAAVGRKANLKHLALEKTGCSLNEKGIPLFDRDTMKVKGAPIYLAGDFDGEKMILHEAADDGRIAGYNSMQKHPSRFKRRVALGITFSSPNLCTVGQRLKDLKDPAIGEVSFAKQGRSVIMQENEGFLRVYADKESGRLMGAELAAPAGEHLAHLIAHAISQAETIDEMLRQPWYHPTVEEGLRTALRAARKQLSGKLEPRLDLERIGPKEESETPA